MTAKGADNCEALFRDISQFIAESRELLERGAIMELAGVDARVQMLCDQVLSLSEEEKHRFAAHLDELLVGLTDLGNEMIARRHALGDEIRHLSSHKKASVAYKVVDNSDRASRSEEDDG